LKPENEKINQSVKEYLSVRCPYLNVQTQSGTLEAYFKEAIRSNTPLDETKMDTLPIGHASTLSLSERAFIYQASFAENMKVARYWQKRTPNIAGLDKILLASNLPKWNSSREYRANILIDELIHAWGPASFARIESSNKDPKLAALVKQMVPYFTSLQSFAEKNYDSYIQKGEEINAQCDKISPSPLVSCVNNKMVLAYLYLYGKRYDDALAMVKTAEKYPLVRDNTTSATSTGASFPSWDPYKAARLGPVVAKVYAEMGNYAEAEKYFLKEIASRPFFRGAIDYRVIKDKLSGKTPFINLDISK